MSGSTVTLTGTPTVSGTFSIGISVVDANGKAFAITAALTIALVGSKSYGGIQGNATAASGTSVTIKGVVVNVSACTSIIWEGNWGGLTKAI